MPSQPYGPTPPPSNPWQWPTPPAAPRNPYNTPGTPQWRHNNSPPAPRPNYNVPPTTEFSPGANAPRPPSALYPGGAPPGGAGLAEPGPELWNGMPVLQHGPGGNVLVSENGVPTAYDQWGNKIPHLGSGYNSADPNAGAAPPAPTGGPTPGTPGVPTPPQALPNTFYAPTTGSPYLQLPSNWLSYMGDTERAQFVDSLRGAGFQATGAYGLNGPSDFIRPPQFDEQDIMALSQNDNIRQWMRFFLGNLGYGIGYQLPGNYQPGTGLPAAPPSPQV